jgi:hypothetical protein
MCRQQPVSAAPPHMFCCARKDSDDNIVLIVGCRYGVPVLGTYDMTLGMHMAHIARDCLHYCSPGVPEVGVTFGLP